MAYELKISNYEGPLEKLLMLIEERKMSITDVSLAAVTDDFLKYLEALRAIISGAEGEGETVAKKEEDLRLLADFIVVASRLLLIKSKSLLPDLTLTEEEERDIKDLETRLALYKQLKAALRNVDERWSNKDVSLSRPYFTHIAGQTPQIFYPGNNVTKENLFTALTRVYESLQKFVMETETIKEVIISLEEKMQDIVKRMQQTAETSLRALGGGSRTNMVVAFLAILHLAREQLVFLEQAEQFADIVVRKAEEQSFVNRDS